MGQSLMGQSFVRTSFVILNLFRDDTRRLFVILKQVQDDEADNSR